MGSASCLSLRLLVRPIDAAMAESGSKQSSDAQNAVGRRSVPTSPGSLDLLRPSLSQNWIARKFEKANTIAASFRTTSCHARLDHFHDVRRCKIFTTPSVFIHRYQGGPDKLSSLRNNHMTILHSSLLYSQYMIYIAFLVRYISTYT